MLIKNVVLDRIVAGESLDMAYLGVGIEDAQAEVVGAIITSVESDSPADEAGLRTGDIVVRVDSTPVTERGDLAATIRLRRPGEVVEVEFVRGGENLVVDVSLDVPVPIDD